MKKPDRAFGANAAEGRNRILSQALEEAVADLRKRFGDDMNAWKWGDIHTTDFVHPLGGTEATKGLFHVEPVRRGGDGFTVMAASSPTETSTKQTSGASFMFVMDVSDWDNSTGLSVPGNSAQPLSPHYKDLTPYWGEGKYFPLAFSRPKVEEVTAHRLRAAAGPRRQPHRERGTRRATPLFAPTAASTSNRSSSRCSRRSSRSRAASRMPGPTSTATATSICSSASAAR